MDGRSFETLSSRITALPTLFPSYSSSLLGVPRLAFYNISFTNFHDTDMQADIKPSSQEFQLLFLFSVNFFTLLFFKNIMLSFIIYFLNKPVYKYFNETKEEIRGYQVTTNFSLRLKFLFRIKLPINRVNR